MKVAACGVGWLTRVLKATGLLPRVFAEVIAMEVRLRVQGVR